MKKEDKLRRPIKLRNFRIWSGLSNLRRNVSLSAIFLIQLGVGEAKLSGKLNCWALHKFNTYNKREINCWWLLLSSWRCLQVSVSFLWTVGEISPVKLFWSAICLEEQNGVWRRDTPKGEILLCHHSSCDQLMYVYLYFSDHLSIPQSFQGFRSWVCCWYSGSFWSSSTPVGLCQH